MGKSRRILHFQVDANEASQLERDAKLLGVSLSELLRRRSLDPKRKDASDTVQIPRKEWDELRARVKQALYGP